MLKKTALIIFCLSLFTVFSAQADDRFNVDIKVDVSDQNASIAREKAMNGANRAAVVTVAKRLSTNNGAERFSKMTDAQLVNFIKETSVISEKLSDTRYMADLHIVINEELLREYMKEREIPVVNKPSFSIIVIPLFREFETDPPLLWEPTNLWRQAWLDSTNDSAIKVTPISDSALNLATINAEKAAKADFNTLTQLQQNTGADYIYVLNATYNGVEGLDVTITDINGNKQELKVLGAKSSGTELFSNAVDQTRATIEQRIINTPSIEKADKEITILYSFDSLSQWISAEQKLKRLNIVTDLQVQAMAQGKAQFKVLYTTSINDLINQFRTLGYLLNENGNHMLMENIGE